MIASYHWITIVQCKLILNCPLTIQIFFLVAVLQTVTIKTERPTTWSGSGWHLFKTNRIRAFTLLFYFTCSLVPSHSTMHDHGPWLLFPAGRSLLVREGQDESHVASRCAAPHSYLFEVLLAKIPGLPCIWLHSSPWSFVLKEASSPSSFQAPFCFLRPPLPFRNLSFQHCLFLSDPKPPV